MMKNLHARSTPTRDRDNESLSEAIRRGQREAIAETLSVGRSVPAEPLDRSADGPSAQLPLRAGERVTGEVSPHVVPAGTSRSDRGSAGPDVHAVHKLPLLLVLVAWILFAFGIFTFASAPSLPSRSSVESSAFLAELPAPSPSAFGQWLLSAVAALSIVAVGKQFMRKTPIEAEFLTKREFQDFKDKEFADLRNRIDHSHELLSNKLDGINTRLSDVGSLVARLDERTKVHAVHSPSTDSTESQIAHRKSQT